MTVTFGVWLEVSGKLGWSEMPTIFIVPEKSSKINKFDSFYQ